MADKELGPFLVEEVYPRLFPRMRSAFPDFSWEKKGDAWVATTWPAGFPFEVGDEHPDRLMVYPDRPWWIKVHGHAGVRFLDLVNKGRKPRGRDFVDAVRHLAGLAGVPFPERELSEKEQEDARKQEGRRHALAVATEHAQEVLLSPAGEDARGYLHGRGFTDGDLAALSLGYYGTVADMGRALRDAGVDTEDTKETALLWKDLAGYIVIPWYDADGGPLTLYGRWPGSPPEGRPKTIALPGEGTKRSPYCFNLARDARVEELVLVEGVFDAAFLQVRGDPRVVASVSAQLSGLQVETLKRHRVRKVFICGDPDGGGDRGTLANVEALQKAGIPSYVVPRLPDGLDPDEYVLKHGLDAWRDRVAASVSGVVFKASTILGNVTPESPPAERQEKVREVGAFLNTVEGEGAAMAWEDVTRLTAERTGYTPEVIAAELATIDERLRIEKAGKSLDKALREASVARNRGEDPRGVSEALRASLDAVRVHAQEAPPPFDVDRLERESRETPAGLSSGWKALDRLEVRFNPGELAVVAGRTGHCKTSALVGLLKNWATDPAGGEGLLVLYSAEEPEVRIYHRLLSLLTADAGDPEAWWTTAQIRDYLRDPSSRDEPRREYGWPDTEALATARESLRGVSHRLRIVHRPAWTVEDVEAHARSLVSGGIAVGAVLVDYLQRVPPPAGRYDRRDIEVSTVARALKSLSVDLGVPVVAGAQINREAVPDKYGSKLAGKSYREALPVILAARPDLHHIREGGAEQEADVVLGLLNYAADVRVEADGKEKPPVITRLEVGVLKNRAGPAGRWARLAYEGKIYLIRDRENHEGDV